MAKFEQLVTFITVVEEKGFAAAGRKLNISNAAVSKQITKLENGFRTELLIRTTRQLALTESGQHLYALAKKFRTEFEEIENLFSGLRKEPSGTLTIGCTWHFAEVVLIPNLMEFYEKYPKVSLDIINVERLPDLYKEGIDINIATALIGRDDYIHRKIAETKYTYCASREYLKKFGTPQKPKDLLKHRYLTHTGRMPDNVLEFKSKKITLEPFMRLNDSRIMIQCALQGLGIIKLHRYALEELIKEGALVEVLKECDEAIQPIYLYYQLQRFLPPKLRCFIDFVCAKIKAEVY